MSFFSEFDGILRSDSWRKQQLRQHSQRYQIFFGIRYKRELFFRICESANWERLQRCQILLNEPKIIGKCHFNSLLMVGGDLCVENLITEYLAAYIFHHRNIDKRKFHRSFKGNFDHRTFDRSFERNLHRRTFDHQEFSPQFFSPQELTSTLYIAIVTCLNIWVSVAEWL